MSLRKNSIRETDWSLEIAAMIVTTEWNCPNCKNTFNMTAIQKLQHIDGKKNTKFEENPF